jgi:plastocyanin
MNRLGMRLAMPLAVLALLAAGCGDDDDGGGGGDAGADKGTGGGANASGGSSSGSGSGGSQTLKLAAPASGAPEFDKTSLTGKAGRTTIVLDNPSSVPHAIELEGNGVEEEGDTVTDGGVSKVTVDLKPGHYRYLCPVDGHEQAGMKGTLTVR